ncbi:MAG: Ig-like domain-containing protein [Pseudomonadota bacterium]
MRKLLNTLTAALLAVVSLSACDIRTYDDAVTEFNNNSQGGGNPPPPPPPPPGASFGPVFSEIQTNLFTPNCATAGCHSGGAPTGNLNLEAASSYMMLIGVASTADANIDRVVPGNANDSYLIQQLEGVGGGAPHPAGSPVPTADIANIRQWILDGAVDDTAQPAAPVQVTSMSPLPNAALTAAPANVTVAFSKDVDASTVNSMTFLLIGAGGDSMFGNGNDVAITAASISVPVANPRSAVFDLTGVTVNDDAYRVRLLGSGASVILDLDALALDGEYAASFPSGNGTAGGDFQADFTIAAPVVLEPNLDSIQSIVFGPTCATAGCHNGVSNAGGLNLSSADASHMNLVGVPSSVDAARIRVIANDAANSYLIEKLGPMPGNGSQMPLGRPPLADADINVIRTWIDNGALR